MFNGNKPAGKISVEFITNLAEKKELGKKRGNLVVNVESAKLTRDTELVGKMVNYYIY